VPYDVHIDHTSRTIVVTGHGNGSTADTLQLIAGQQETFRTYPGYNFLYDAYDLEIVSTPAEMLDVAHALFDRSNASFPKFAIVVPHARLQLARMFIALAHPYGIVADVFSDIGEARQWLGIDS